MPVTQALNDPEMLTERVPILTQPHLAIRMIATKHAKCMAGVHTRAHVQEMLSLGSRAY